MFVFGYKRALFATVECPMSRPRNNVMHDYPNGALLSRRESSHQRKGSCKRTRNENPVAEEKDYAEGQENGDTNLEKKRSAHVKEVERKAPSFPTTVTPLFPEYAQGTKPEFVSFLLRLK